MNNILSFITTSYAHCCSSSQLLTKEILTIGNNDDYNYNYVLKL